MKIKATILLIVILLQLLHNKTLADTIQVQDLKAIELTLNNIFKDLDSIFTNSDVHSSNVEQHFNYVLDKIYKGELPVTYDSTLNYDYFGCASFDIYENNGQSAKISIGKYVIDKYDNYPALVYAIIISTFQNAYDYYNNKNLFLISIENQIEKTYFEIDAMYLEALFLSTYMKDKPDLGYFEKYLISDLEHNLNGSATLFNRTDLELLHKIDNLKNLDKTEDKILKEFNDIGKNLIKDTIFNDKSEWINYCSVVTLRTYVFYSKQVIFDIVHAKNGVNMESFKLEDYNDNLTTINEIQKIINNHKELFNYHKETVKLFSNYYKK